MVGSIATAVLVCGAIAQLAVGRLVEWVPPLCHIRRGDRDRFSGNLWATYATVFPLMMALAIAIAAIYGQVTVNDIILARYTADAWRGRVYAIRYFTLFISAGAAVGDDSLLHRNGGFCLVLGVNAIIALIMFITTLGFGFPHYQHRSRHSAAQPAE